MSKEYYIIKSRYSDYYSEIWHQYPNIDKVYVGGKKRCVTLSVYFDEPNPNIDGIGYDENCNITGNLIKGSGTRHMVLSALSFIETKYKNKGVSSVFLLKDSSTIDCKGFDMYLPHYYMLYYNQTWYQKQFHAIPLKTPSDFINDRKALVNYLKTKPAAEELFASVKSSSRQKYLATFIHHAMTYRIS